MGDNYKTADQESNPDGDIQSNASENDNHTSQQRDPHAMGKKINEYQALMSLIKGNIGTGILSMPVVLKYAGLWFLMSFFPHLTLNVYLVGFIVCLLLIVMNFKSSMRVVTYLSGLANICTALGMILIFVYLFTSGLYSVERFPAITNFNNLLIAFSIVMFSFEGISLVLPIQSKMLDPSGYGSRFGVLTTGMIVVVCMNAAVGFFGFLRFGEQSEGSITLNIPQVPYWFAPVKPLFIIAMFVSYLLQYYVPAQIFSRLMEKLKCHHNASNQQRYINLKLMRISLVIFSYAAAVLIPRLDLLLSLIGSLAGSTLAFILPATLELIYLWPDRGNISWFWLKVFTKHMIFISIGLLSCFGGLIATIMQIVDVFRSKSS